MKRSNCLAVGTLLTIPTLPEVFWTAAQRMYPVTGGGGCLDAACDGRLGWFGAGGDVTYDATQEMTIRVQYQNHNNWYDSWTQWMVERLLLLATVHRENRSANHCACDSRMSFLGGYFV